MAEELDPKKANAALDATAGATKKLTKGVKDLAGAFGDTALKYATGLPTLEDTTKATGKFSKAVGYLEGQLGVFNEMSQYGVTFGGELDKMTVKATAARMTQEQLTKTIKNANGDFTLFGATANAGLQTFLTNQAEFYDTMPLAADNLRRLGMSTEEINESMLAYDKISRMNNRRDMRSTAERNRSAAAFAEEMDLMAKLQGKSRKELQAEMEARAREGRIIALKSGLEKDMADALDQNLQKAAAFGPGVEGVMKDMMAMGVPSKDNAKLFALLGAEAQNSMRAMKKAQDAGDVAEYNRQMGIFQAAMEKRGKDENVRRMALLGGLNEYSQIAGEIITNTQTGMGAALADARATLEAEVAAGKRRAFTEEEVTELARKRAKAEQDAQKRDGGEGTTKAVTDALIAAQMKSFEVAEKVQVEATTKLYKELSGAASGFTKSLTEANPEALVEKVLNLFSDISKEITGSAGISSTPEEIDTATMNLAGAGDVDTLAKVKELENQLQTAKPEERQGIIDQIKQLTTKANSMVVEGNVNIHPDGETIIHGNQQPQDTGLPTTGLNTGTVGVFGKLFADFGKGTKAMLHNEEMVATKPQLAAGLTEFAKELRSTFGGSSKDQVAAQQKTANELQKTLGAGLKMKPDNSIMEKEISSFGSSMIEQSKNQKSALESNAGKFAKISEDMMKQMDVGKMGASLDGVAKEIGPGLASMGSQLQGQVSSIRPQMQNMASSMAPQLQEMAKTMQSNMPDLQNQMMGFADALKGPMENMAKNMEEQLTVSKKGVNINDKQLRSSKAMIGNVFGGIGVR